jgi:hypothetical protein
MAYPFVLATNGQFVARVNHDGSWSVLWDRVLDVIYDKPNPRRVAVTAFARLLWAAKDNFVLTAWDTSEQWRDEWKHFQAEIDYIDHDPEQDACQSTISYNGDLIARVNHDGSWSILWDDVGDLSRQPIEDYRGVALIALCRLFMAAKDRFWTSAWDIEDEDD